MSNAAGADRLRSGGPGVWGVLACLAAAGTLTSIAGAAQAITAAAPTEGRAPRKAAFYENMVRVRFEEGSGLRAVGGALLRNGEPVAMPFEGGYWLPASGHVGPHLRERVRERFGIELPDRSDEARFVTPEGVSAREAIALLNGIPGVRSAGLVVARQSTEESARFRIDGGVFARRQRPQQQAEARAARGARQRTHVGEPARVTDAPVFLADDQIPDRAVPDFRADQYYYMDYPVGTGAFGAETVPGGTGENVRIFYIGATPDVRFAGSPYHVDTPAHFREDGSLKFRTLLSFPIPEAAFRDGVNREIAALAMLGAPDLEPDPGNPSVLSRRGVSGPVRNADIYYISAYDFPLTDILLALIGEQDPFGVTLFDDLDGDDLDEDNDGVVNEIDDPSGFGITDFDNDGVPDALPVFDADGVLVERGTVLARPGDIVIIGFDADYQYVVQDDQLVLVGPSSPVSWWEDNYAAIVAVQSMDVMTVEIAGTQGADLNSDAYMPPGGEPVLVEHPPESGEFHGPDGRHHPFDPSGGLHFGLIVGAAHRILVTDAGGNALVGYEPFDKLYITEPGVARGYVSSTGFAVRTYMPADGIVSAGYGDLFTDPFPGAAPSDMTDGFGDPIRDAGGNTAFISNWGGPLPAAVGVGAAAAQIQSIVYQTTSNPATNKPGVFLSVPDLLDTILRTGYRRIQNGSPGPNGDYRGTVGVVPNVYAALDYLFSGTEDSPVTADSPFAWRFKDCNDNGVPDGIDVEVGCLEPLRDDNGDLILDIYGRPTIDMPDPVTGLGDGVADQCIPTTLCEPIFGPPPIGGDLDPEGPGRDGGNCVGDWNGDGDFDFDDFALFVQDYLNGNPYALELGLTPATALANFRAWWQTRAGCEGGPDVPPDGGD